ncbi:MAG: hypothetical protein ACXVB0_09095 [Mucilaginibacter sp.]
MKKLVLTLAIAAGIAFGSSAQTTTPSSKIGGGSSIGVDGAVPVGSGADVYSWGLGGSIKYDARMYPGIFFTLSAGYEAFFIKSDLKFPGTPSSISATKKGRNESCFRPFIGTNKLTLINQDQK